MVWPLWFMLKTEPLCLSTQSVIFLRLKRLMVRALLEAAVFDGFLLQNCVTIVLESLLSARFTCVCDVQASFVGMKVI
jgi:hypothetical protein